MSKSVLISIQPKWCELIASGKKTVMPNYCQHCGAKMDGKKEEDLPSSKKLRNMLKQLEEGAENA